MIVANFTPDDIEWMHIGVNGVLKSGEIKEYDDGRANHILNKWGARGLLALKYGDKSEEKQKEAMIIWKQFWGKQITTFNQNNEKRKATQLEYVFSTPDLEEHADKLGIRLVAPWRLEETGSEKERKLSEENAELKIELRKTNARMDELMKKFETLLSSVGGESAVILPQTPGEKAGMAAAPPNKPLLLDDEQMRKQFKYLQKKQFKDWVIDNFAIFPETTPAIMNEIREKWASMFPEEDFPIPM